VSFSVEITLSERYTSGKFCVILIIKAVFNMGDKSPKNKETKKKKETVDNTGSTVKQGGKKKKKTYE